MNTELHFVVKFVPWNRIFRAVEKEVNQSSSISFNLQEGQSLFSVGIWSHLPDSIINLRLSMRILTKTFLLVIFLVKSR